MPYCSAINCKNRFRKNCGKTFHRFPRNEPIRLHEWLIRLQKDDWSPSQSSTLCSDHFEEWCFDRTGQTTRLRSNAIPTVFNFPGYMKREVPSTSDPVSVYTQGPITTTDGIIEIAVVQDAEECEEKSVNDHAYSINHSPRTLRRKLDEMRDVHTLLKKRLKASQTRTSRLTKTVSDLRSIVEGLIEQHVVLENELKTLRNGSEVSSNVTSNVIEVSTALLENIVAADEAE